MLPNMLIASPRLYSFLILPYPVLCFLSPLAIWGKGCPQDLWACSKDHRGIQSLMCLSMTTAQISNKSSEDLEETEQVGRPPTAPLPSTESHVAPAACCSESPQSLYHNTHKTCSISTFQGWLYEKSDAEVFFKYPHIYKKSTSRGMVRVSFNLMLNSILIRVGHIFPPKTCCPQTATCHQNLQNAYEGWRSCCEEDRDFAAHTGKAWSNQKVVKF